MNAPLAIPNQSNGMPSWAKGLMAVAGTFVGIVLLGKLYESLNKNDTEKATKQFGKDVKSEAETLAKTMTPSFKESEYKAMADIIYEGMKVCVGDDYGAVQTTLKKMKNDLDVAKLQEVFGSRQAYCFGVPAGEPKKLIPFVKSELGAEWGGLTGYRVTDINKDWKAKGITYSI